MVHMIKLSDERGDQLEAIAKAKNTTVADLLVEYIRSEIAAKTIPDTIPGIDVAKDGPAITIKAEGFEVSVPLSEGPTLGDVLRGAATLADDAERKKRWVEGAAALSGVRVIRTGPNSLKLVSPLTNNKYSLPLNVAADLGDQIDKAAK